MTSSQIWCLTNWTSKSKFRVLLTDILFVPTFSKFKNTHYPLSCLCAFRCILELLQVMCFPSDFQYITQHQIRYFLSVFQIIVMNFSYKKWVKHCCRDNTNHIPCDSKQNKQSDTLMVCWKSVHNPTRKIHSCANKVAIILWITLIFEWIPKLFHSKTYGTILQVWWNTELIHLQISELFEKCCLFF